MITMLKWVFGIPVMLIVISVIWLLGISLLINGVLGG